VRNAQFADLLHQVARATTVSHNAGTVNAGCNFLNLLLHTIGILVRKLQRFRRIILHRVGHQLCQFHSSFTTLREGIVHCKAHTQFVAMRVQQFNFFLGIRSVFVESHHNVLPESAQVAHMLIEVAQALFQSF